ncbi:MAG TPA: hypothetical protein VGR29_08435, partial [Thermomicrobiales bacterium]|nr:hypothetical protein [Thermomicrobiales bacterium]
MSSRHPAAEEFPSSGMPDLPADLYGDDDAQYAPPRRPLSRKQRQGPAESPDSRSPRRQRPLRTQPDVVFEEIPRGDQRRGYRPKDTPDVTDGRTQSRERQAQRATRASQISAEGSIERDEVARNYVPSQERRRQRRQPLPADNRPQRRSHSTGTPPRYDRVIEQPRMQAQGAAADVITSIRPVHGERSVPRRRHRNPAWTWKPIVMPQPRQILAQALPNLLMATTAVVILALLPYMPFGLPLWAPLLMMPMLALIYFADETLHPTWARAAVVNLATVGAFFPAVIVRQSVLRVPFVEWGNGTLAMPILATIGAVVLLAALAAGSAVLSEEDPEYAGIIFLPAALMVPFFAGATEITNLVTAFMVMAAVYAFSAVLTVVASMLPG